MKPLDCELLDLSQHCCPRALGAAQQPLCGPPGTFLSYSQSDIYLHYSLSGVHLTATACLAMPHTLFGISISGSPFFHDSPVYACPLLCHHSVPAVTSTAWWFSTLRVIRITWRDARPCLLSLGVVLRICFSNKSPSEANAASSGTQLRSILYHLITCLYLPPDRELLEIWKHFSHISFPRSSQCPAVMQSINKYLLSASYVPGTVIGTGFSGLKNLYIYTCIPALRELSF